MIDSSSNWLVRWLLRASATMPCLVLSTPREPADALETVRPVVDVVVVRKRHLPFEATFPGRIAASRVSEVRAQATGYIQAVLFQQGSEVEAGQPLFRIDPAPYEAAFRRATARLQRDQAMFAVSEMKRRRDRPLEAAGFVSKQGFTEDSGASSAAAADIAVDQEDVRRASIALGYTRVIAPISG